MRTVSPLLVLALLASVEIGCAPALRIGARAPDFTATDGRGRRVGLDAFAGRVVVLYFWMMNDQIELSDPDETVLHDHRQADALYEHYRDDERVEVLGVHGLDWGDPQRFFFDNEINLPTIGEGEAIVSAYGIRGFPSFVIVGMHKEIIYFQEQYDDGDDQRMIKIIDQYLFSESIPSR